MSLDAFTIRVIVGAVGILAVVSVLGIIVLAQQAIEIPQVLTAVVSSALGSFTTMLMFTVRNGGEAPRRNRTDA